MDGSRGQERSDSSLVAAADGPEPPEAGPAAEGPGRRARRMRGSSARGALVLMVGTLASRVTGLLRNSLLVQLFPTVVTDAFVTAFKVPNLFRELLAEGALTNSFVPVYKGLSAEEGRRLSGALLGLLAVANGTLMLLAYLLAPALARLLIGNPALVDVELTTALIRIVFPFLPAISFSALAMGILNAEERFAAPAWAPVMLNIVTVTLMALYPGQAVMLALAHVLGGAAQLALQLPALAAHGLSPRLGSLWHPALGGVLLLMVPFALTTSGRQVLNVLASKVVTSIAVGAQTAFYNADLFFSLALGLFSISPALAYYSRLSGHAADEPESFAPTLLEGLRLIALLTVPAGLGLTVLAPQAVAVVFDWRALAGAPLDDDLLQLTVAATAPLGLAVFPVGLFNLLVRTFYVRRRVFVPVSLVLGTLTLQGALYLLLAPPLGIAGVSWATVIASWAQLALALLLVSRSEGLGPRPLLVTAGRAWLAGLGAALLALGALAALPLPGGWYGELAALALGGAVLVAAYLLLCLALGVRELRRLVGRRR